MLLRPMEDKVRKENAIQQGIFSNGSCTTNCIRLRINAGNKVPQMPKIRLLQMHMETNS